MVSILRYRGRGQIWRKQKGILSAFTVPLCSRRSPDVVMNCGSHAAFRARAMKLLIFSNELRLVSRKLHRIRSN